MPKINDWGSNMKKKIMIVLTTILLIISGFSLAETYIFPVEFATPATTDISMKDAILIAKIEVTQQQRLTPGFIDQCPITANFVTLENAETAWIVTIFGDKSPYWTETSLTISSSDGIVIEYHERGSSLDVEFYKQWWMPRKGEREAWSLEDRAIFHTLYSHPLTTQHTIPGDGMLSQEEAISIALSAVPQTFSKPDFQFSFTHTPTESGTSNEYVWRITILENGEKRFQVNLSAIDGVILDVFGMGKGLG
jgi:hypothetical protein